MSVWNAMEKVAYTGLGLAALTKEKLDEAVETLKKERGLTEAEGRKLAEEMKSSAEAARGKLDERIEKAVDRGLKSMNLASIKEVEALQTRIAKLEKRLKDQTSTGK